MSYEYRRQPGVTEEDERLDGRRRWWEARSRPADREALLALACEPGWSRKTHSASNAYRKGILEESYAEAAGRVCPRGRSWILHWEDECECGATGSALTAAAEPGKVST